MSSRVMNLLPRQLHWQILIALIAAALAGMVTPQEGVVVETYAFVGTLFLNALKMLVVPLILAAIIAGTSNLTGNSLGQLGLKTLVYYLTTTFLAVVTGLLFINLIAPGVIDGQPAAEKLGLAASTESVMRDVEGRSGDIVAIFLRMLPPNIVAAAAEGQMLGLIVFGLLFGFATTRIKGELGEVQRRFWNGAYETMIVITEWVMRFAPIGVFALVAKVVTQTGWESIQTVLVFFAAVLAALGTHFLFTLPIMLKVIGRVSPIRHYRAMSPALLTAFSTSSSSATLPVTLDCVQRRAGVSRQTSSFVLPLGATINMDGTALYECAVVLFIAQAYGLDLSIAQQMLVVITALVTSIGVAGIPSASLVAIAVILAAVGLPLEGIGLVLVVDRVLDMCRTAVNVFSDSCGAVVIARLQGEEGILEDRPVETGQN